MGTVLADGDFRRWTHHSEDDWGRSVSARIYRSERFDVLAYGVVVYMVIDRKTGVDLLWQGKDADRFRLD